MTSLLTSVICTALCVHTFSGAKFLKTKTCDWKNARQTYNKFHTFHQLNSSCHVVQSVETKALYGSWNPQQLLSLLGLSCHEKHRGELLTLCLLQGKVKIKLSVSSHTYKWLMWAFFINRFWHCQGFQWNKKPLKWFIVYHFIFFGVSPLVYILSYFRKNSHWQFCCAHCKSCGFVLWWI